MGRRSDILRCAGLAFLIALGTGAAEAWYAFGALVAVWIGYVVYKINTAACPEPPYPKIAAGKTRICVVGGITSSPTATAHYLADTIAQKFPDKYDTWYWFCEAPLFYKFTAKRFGSPDIVFPEHLKGHGTMPFCFLEDASGKLTPIGGSDHLQEWAKKTFSGDAEIVKHASRPWRMMDYITGSAHHTGIGRPRATCNGLLP